MHAGSTSRPAAALWTNPNEIPGDGIDNDHDGMVDDVHGWNVLDSTNDVSDNSVHGTAVAAAIHSVAPGVSILPVEIGDANGVDSQNVIAGINYLIALKKAGVKIAAINASFLRYYPPTPDEVKAIKAAGDNDMLYVAAAGNDAQCLDLQISGVPSWLIKYIPAHLPPNLVFVAATDNQDQLASFSDYGQYTVAVGAPGVAITLPVPGGQYATLTGTSFAAAMVSGVVGLMKSEVPNANFGALKNAMYNTGPKLASLSGTTRTGRRVNAYDAVNALLGKKAPTGGVEVLNNALISGWAFDANLGAAASSVTITVDGKAFATVPANLTRNDLTATLGSAGHGFTFDASTIPYGIHKIKVYAVDDATSKLTLIGQGPLTVDTAPTGAVEAAGAKSVTGWTFDSDTPGQSTKVKLFLDGKAWKTASANVARADLAGRFPTDPASTTGVVKHGFSFNLGTLKPGLHRLDVYAVDTLTGTLTLLGANSVSSNQPAIGAVEVLNNTTLSGWAFDPDAGGGAIQIQYRIDDSAPVFVTANVSRPDLQTPLGSKKHGFSVALPQLPAGDHTITVSAIDPNNKMLVPLTARTLTFTNPVGNPLPAGTIDFTSTQITGTVTAGAAAGPVPIRITIDSGGTKPRTYAATATADLHGNLTFAFTLPALTGPRRVDVFALDDQTAAPVLLARRLLNYTAPTATVESFTSAGVSGAAIAPSASKGLALLRLDVDGLAGNLVTANLSRPDYLLALGRSNVGYSIPMPPLAPGNHSATLHLIDPTTLTATFLDDLTFAST